MFLQGVDFLAPPAYSPVLAHGFAELIKNHLMGRRTSACSSTRCKLCFNFRCLRRVAMLTPNDPPLRSETFMLDEEVTGNKNESIRIAG